MKKWHVNSVVNKGENLHQSFANEHGTEAEPRSDGQVGSLISVAKFKPISWTGYITTKLETDPCNKQPMTRDTGLHNLHTKQKQQQKANLYIDTTSIVPEKFPFETISSCISGKF